MEELYQQQTVITPSLADASGRLGCADAFGLFMDLAASHAERLGIGLAAMAARGLFWLTVKTQIRFLRRPGLMTAVTARTWPEAPGKMRGDRSYELTQDGETLVAGKTEWAVLDTRTHGLTPMEGVYPAGLGFTLGTACPGAFARIPEGFDDAPYAAYTVRSTDIDVGGHMNNAAYVRAVMGSFSAAELAAMPIGRMDVIFRTPCYEGDVLALRRRDSEAGVDVRVSRGEETVLLVRIAP